MHAVRGDLSAAYNRVDHGRFVPADDGRTRLRVGRTQEQLDAFIAQVDRYWGGPVGIEARAPRRLADEGFRQRWARDLRISASPTAAATLLRMNSQIDIRDVLPIDVSLNV